MNHDEKPMMPPVLALVGPSASTIFKALNTTSGGVSPFPFDALARECAVVGGVEHSRMAMRSTAPRYISAPDEFATMASPDGVDLADAVRKIHEYLRARHPSMVVRAFLNAWGDRGRGLGESTAPLTLLDVQDLAFFRQCVESEGPLARWDLVVIECVQYPGPEQAGERPPRPDFVAAAEPPQALVGDESWNELDENARESIRQIWLNGQTRKIHHVWQRARRSRAREGRAC